MPFQLASLYLWIPLLPITQLQVRLVQLDLMFGIAKGKKNMRVSEPACHELLATLAPI
jgi:hypothetical protein